MIPVEFNEMFMLFSLMVLRFGVPLLLILLLGTLAQRVERFQP